MHSLKITSGTNSVTGSVSLPLSKSISNRSLIISWLSGGKVRTGSLSAAEDTFLLQRLLRQMEEAGNKKLHAGNAGTVYRFLTALLAVTPGEWVLDGDERMYQRPIAPLVEALRELGAQIHYLGREGFPPLRISGQELEGGRIRIRADVSSQFISALLMIGPVMSRGIDIFLEGDLVSMPYMWLTIDMMKMAGARINTHPFLRVRPYPYQECTLPSVTDWSAAAPWYTIMALAGSGSLLLRGLTDKSLQGDQTLPSFFIMFGVDTEWMEDGVRISKRKIVRREVNFDLNSTPDLAPSIIVTAAAMGYKGHFTGLKALRIKESDRIEAVANELNRNGFKCITTADTLSFLSQELLIKHPVETHNDHRIAMAFAPLAMSGNALTIIDPGVVKKSYPGFWEEMGKFMMFENI